LALLTINGAQLEVLDAGPEGALPFLFIHGWACDQRSWAPQVADLSRDYRCFSLNFRGRGASEQLGPYGVPQQAADIAAVIEALGVGPVILAAHALGGFAALLACHEHPELVRGIAIADTPLREHLPPHHDAFSEAIIRDGTTERIRPLLERFWVPGTPDGVKEEVTAMMLGCPPEVAARMLEGRPTALRDLVKSADRKPFLAFLSDRNQGDLSWLRQVTMFVRVEPMPGAGHFFQLEQPAITNAILRAFVDDVLRDPR
jgi:pimeloyl-ACP methyl ester carboxylesterase